MGTKNNPGQFDCYANAEPDERLRGIERREQFLTKRLAERSIELGRLSDENANLAASCAMKNREIDAKDAEIERLREELNEQTKDNKDIVARNAILANAIVGGDRLNKELRARIAELCEMVIQLLTVVEFKRRTTPPFSAEPSELEIRASDLLTKAKAGVDNG